MINKKGQTFSGFMIFAFIFLAMLIASPFLLKFFTSPVQKFSDAVGNVEPRAAQAINFVKEKTLSFWDSVVLFSMLIMLLVLIVSSFLIDVHPFFVILYVISGVMFFAFAPAVNPVLEKIYSSPSFSTEVSYIPALEFVVEYFWQIIIGIYVFTGLVMFIKIRFFPSGVR